MDPTLLHGRRRLILACAALGACARLPVESGSTQAPDTAPEGWIARHDYLLLGEVHDNPEHHRRRLAWLTQWSRTQRFVVAMEQFDADRQSAIDAARAAGLQPRALAEAAGFDDRGWSWTHYGPFVSLALQQGLPLVAANLSAADTRAIARGGQSRDTSAPAGWRPQDQAVLEQAIADGHCGALPARAITPMAVAQRARDARMARALTDARTTHGLPVVLLAGNGHVRTDVGVPRHLAGLQPTARVFAVGLLEHSGGDPTAAGTFDRTLQTPPHPRGDPCAVFRAPQGPAR